MSTKQIAFNPLSSTIAVAAAAVAPAGVQAALPANGSYQAGGQYRVVNAGPSIVFLGVGPAAALAQSRAVAPVAGTPSLAIAVLPGAVEVFSFGELAYFSGLAAAPTTVYITQGAGV